VSDTDPSLIQALRPVVARLRTMQEASGGSLIVAIDGRSGAGKSTVARHLAAMLGAGCVAGDDFFAAEITASGWEARNPAQRAADALDWRRLRAEAIEPLRAGKVARWSGFDFSAGERADGSFGRLEVPTVREPRPVVLLDGAYTAQPELADLLDCAILVEAPGPVRASRLAAREKPDVLQRWHARWDAAEEHYFTRVRPPASFDIVLDFDHDRDTWHATIRQPAARGGMTSRGRWILALGIATAVDLAARFATGFDFGRVMHVEAALFPLTALSLATLLRHEPRTHGWPHALRVGLVWLFGLGGLRPLLWTLGVPLMTANLATLVAGVAGLAFAAAAGHSARRGAQRPTPPRA